MTKVSNLVVSFLAVCALSACGRSPRCPTSPAPELKIEPGKVTVSGSWIDDPGNKRSVLGYRLNTFKLECEKQTGRCVEARAYLSRWDSFDLFGAAPIQWRVAAWSPAELVAESANPAHRTKARLTVDLKANKAAYTVTGPDLILTARLGTVEDACRAAAQPLK